MNSSLLASSMLLASVVTVTGCIDTGMLQKPGEIGGARGVNASGAGGSGAGPSGKGGGGPSDSGGAAGHASTLGAGGGGPGARPGTASCTTIIGLVAHYTFDTDTTDSSGNGHDIVATSVTPTTGILGGAYLLDGFNSLMRVTGGTDSLLSGARTFCAWVNPQSVTGAAQPIFAGGTAGDGDFFSLLSSTAWMPSPAYTCIGNEGEPLLDHGNTGCVEGTGLTARNGTWSFVCYSNDGGYNETFTINGTSVGSYGENYSYPVSTLTIGSQALGSASSQRTFRGAIDEVSIWNRALSQPELWSLWNGGTPCSPPKPGTGIALVTGADGQLEPNAAGAVGDWWSGGDYYGVDGTPGGGNCATLGFPATACSSVTTPIPGTVALPDANGRMCAAGTVGQVVAGPDGLLAWGSIWGNMVLLNLAKSDPSLGAPAGSYDASAHGITGFAFDIEGTLPPGHLRVGVPTVENDGNSAYWDGADMNASPFNGPGHYEFRWSEVGGPMYLGGAAPPFDPTKILSIAFSVVTDVTGPMPYDFCVSKLLLLTN